jgi:RNA polymerase sigma-70 factor (ECF subfamily)
MGLLRDCLETGAPGAWDRFIALAKPVIAPVVVAVIRRWKRDFSQVDDLVQDTFVRLCAADFRALRNFRGQDAAALHSYLRTIASSVAADRFRGDSARVVSLDDPDLAPPVADNRPARDIERRLLLDRIQKCLTAHAPRDRWIFWLYHRDGMTPQAISTLPSIGIGRSGVETLIYRLTKAVANCVLKGFPPPAEGSLR